MYWIKIGLIALGCFALYLLAWPIPNYVEKLFKGRRGGDSDWPETAFVDHFGSGTQPTENLPVELERQIAAFARTHQLTRSEAIQALVETGLAIEAQRTQARTNRQ